MKNGLLLITFFFTASFLFAQHLSLQNCNNIEKIQIDSIVTTERNGDTEYVQGILKYNFDFFERLFNRHRFERPAMYLPYFEEKNFQYLDNGHHIIATTKRKEINMDDFINYEKTESFIDDNGLLLEEHLFDWDSENSVWMETMSGEYSFNEKDKRIRALIFKLVDEEDGLEFYSKDTIVYNEADNIDYIHTQKTYSGQLVNYKKIENIYLGDTLLSSQFNYKWDSIENAWNTQTRKDYFYEDLSSMEISYGWDKVTSEFIKHFKTDLLYNIEGDLEKIITSNWSNNDEVWKPQTKITYILDYSYQPEDVIVPVAFKGIGAPQFPVGRLMETSISKLGIDEWLMFRKDVYYYSTFQPLLIQEISAKKLDIYPNPADHFISIEDTKDYDSFAIYSIDGRKIVESPLLGNRIIVSFLQKGTYILKLFGDSKVTGTAVFVKK